MINLNDFDVLRISQSKLKDISGGAGYSFAACGKDMCMVDHVDAQGCTDNLDGKGHNTCDSSSGC